MLQIKLGTSPSDFGPTSPSTNLITPGTWQNSHLSSWVFFFIGMTRPGKVVFDHRISRSRGGRLTTRSVMRFARGTTHHRSLSLVSWFRKSASNSGRPEVQIRSASHRYLKTTPPPPPTLAFPQNTWHDGVSARTGRSGVSILRGHDVGRLICNVCLIVSARRILSRLVPQIHFAWFSDINPAKKLSFVAAL